MTLLRPAAILGFLLISSSICNAASTAGTWNLANTSSLQFRSIIIDEPETGTRFIIGDYFKYDDPNRRWIPKISYDPRTERRLANHESFQQCLELWRNLIGQEGQPTDQDKEGIYTSFYGFWLDISVRRPFPRRKDELAALRAVSQNLNYFLDRDRDPDWGYRPLKIRILSSATRLQPMRLLGEMVIRYQPDWQPGSLEGPLINQTTTTEISLQDTLQVAKSRRRRGSNPAVTDSSGRLPASVEQPKRVKATVLNTTSLGFFPISINDYASGAHLLILDKLDVNDPIWLPKVSKSPMPRPGVVNEESLVECLGEWRKGILKEGPPQELDKDPSFPESYGFILDITPRAPYATFLEEAAALWHVRANVHEFLETEIPLPGRTTWYRPIQVEISRIDKPEQVLSVMEITYDPFWHRPGNLLELPSANQTTGASIPDSADLTKS